jgi:hypothetical protein
VNSSRQFVAGWSMHLAMRELRPDRMWRGLLKAVAFGAVLGVMGPFGSQNAFAPAVRYPLWIIISLAGFGAVAAADRVLVSTLPSAKTLIRIAAIGAASAVPMTFFVAWTFSVVQPGRSFSPVQLLTLFPFVALVQLLIAGVMALDDRKTAAATANLPPAAPAYPREFLLKLPASLRRDIIALEAEDHYVRVYTLHGSALILMRLADAAAIIDPRLGLRVHRSWWVAKEGVRALETTAGRTIARLIDDRAVPISRSYLPTARKILAF